MYRIFSHKLTIAKSSFNEIGALPTIVGVMLLMLSAVVSLSLGLSDIASGIAIYAFYVLVIEVVLQLAFSLKYGKKTLRLRIFNESS